MKRNISKHHFKRNRNMCNNNPAYKNRELLFRQYLEADRALFNEGLYERMKA